MNTDKLKNNWLAIGSPLTMEDKIIDMRREIELGTIPRKDKKVLLIAAYNEMRNRMGKVDRNMDCGSCSSELLRQMTIWLNLYDKRTPAQKLKCKADIENYKLQLAKPKHQRGVKEPMTMPNLKTNNSEPDKQLKPVDVRKSMYNEMEFMDLVKLIETLPAEAQDRLEKNKTRNFPKKVDIIAELLLIKPKN